MESWTSKVRNSRKLWPMDLSLVLHLPWQSTFHGLAGCSPLEEDVFPKHSARREGLTRAIVEKHTLSRKQTEGAKQPFVDALQLQGKYDLSEDTIIRLLWAVARDPTGWKDPLEFRPERFLEEDVNMKYHNFCLLPFGRTVCPGAQTGINLVTSILSH